jgi:K+ transport systems, NAD-binding component
MPESAGCLAKVAFSISFALHASVFFPTAFDYAHNHAQAYIPIPYLCPMGFLISLIALLLHRRRPNFVLENGEERFRTSVNRLAGAIGLLVLAILSGMVGYHIIEGFTWFEAYYMSLVTLSTVGFGEVFPLSDSGRIFTSFLILFNIGFFAYAISTITSILTDGKLKAFLKSFHMLQRIQKLENHTVVCGFGLHATEVCKELQRQHIPFVAIEMDKEKAERLKAQPNYLYLHGDATDDEVLQAAGIEKAAALVSTLPSDANNLYVVLSARQLNPNLKIISRLSNPEGEAKLRRAGADHVVMTEKISGYYMATLVNKPDLADFFSLISHMAEK